MRQFLNGFEKKWGKRGEKFLARKLQFGDGDVDSIKGKMGLKISA